MSRFGSINPCGNVQQLAFTLSPGSLRPFVTGDCSWWSPVRFLPFICEYQRRGSRSIERSNVLKACFDEPLVDFFETKRVPFFSIDQHVYCEKQSFEDRVLQSAGRWQGG